MTLSGNRLSSFLRLTLGMLFAGLSAGNAAHAQNPASNVPTVTFTLDFPGSEPEHFVLSVSSDGHAVYDSNGKLTPQSEAGDPFHLEFTASKPTCDRVFELAKRAHYFSGDIDSKGKNLAFTGAKTLSYSDGHKQTKGAYNYSPVPGVEELTALFQGLSTTLEFGRRLQSYHRYQKLALDDELTRMEEMARDNQLAELPAVAPILRSIADDSSVMSVVRSRALRLLLMAQAPVPKR